MAQKEGQKLQCKTCGKSFHSDNELRQHEKDCKPGQSAQR
jgi:hypothetical protein